MKTPTQVTTEELKAQLDRSVQLLRTFRDEARVELHLFGMDARDEWERLQPQVHAAEKAVSEFAHEAAESSRRTVETALEAMKRFQAKLGERASRSTEVRH